MAVDVHKLHSGDVFISLIFVFLFLHSIDGSPLKPHYLPHLLNNPADLLHTFLVKTV